MREREVSVPGPAWPLSATLTLPEGAGPFPAAVLVSGSGPLDRDGNHPKGRFDVSRQLAVALAERGVASLRYDKRGVGRTPGDWRAVGFHDNVDDAAAAVATLSAVPEVRDDAVFVVGHSEGALIATALAARAAAGATAPGEAAPGVRPASGAAAPGVRPAGVVLLAGAARPGEEVLLWQTRAIAPSLPRPVRLVLRLLRVDPTAKVAANHARVKATTTDVARLGPTRVNARWLREFMAYDPAQDLARIDVPVLAVTGAKDLQVPPADLPRIAELAGAETHELPDVTHTLRAQPGPPALSRYKGELRRPVDAGLLRLVTDWVVRTADAVRPSTAGGGTPEPGPRPPAAGAR
ncbi:MAG: alpha/beta hydrolase family protein [Nocardioidaceae bacterium]